jgi:hypothetical protein
MQYGTFQVQDRRMVINRGNPASTHFLNVDLDIYSKADLQPLVSALAKKIMVLYVGRASKPTARTSR